MERRTTATSAPEVFVCGTLVADMRVRPFHPINARTGSSIRRVEEIRLLPGGIVANTGLALSRLGVPTALLGRLGNDAIGDVMLAALRRDNLDLTGLKRMHEVATAPVIVCIDARGERTFHYAEGANTLFALEDMDDQFERLAGARAVVVGYFGELPHLDSHLPALFARLKRQGQPLIVLETAGPQAPQRDMLAQCMPFVDLFLPSWEEARDLTGARTAKAALHALALLAPTAVVGIKMGKRGCLIAAQGRRFAVPAYPVTMRDATGAGDAFLAAFIAGCLRGYDPEQCARLGNMAGALTVSAADGHTALPAFERLLELVRDHDPPDGKQALPNAAHGSVGEPSRA